MGFRTVIYYGPGSRVYARHSLDPAPTPTPLPPLPRPPPPRLSAPASTAGPSGGVQPTQIGPTRVAAGEAEIRAEADRRERVPPVRLTADEATLLLVGALKAVRVYSWIPTLSCTSTRVEDEQIDFIEIGVFENHQRPCKGHPLTAPRLDTFRVDRKTGAILWSDYGDGWLEFTAMVRFRRGGPIPN